METFSIVLSVLILILSIFSLVSYIKHRGGVKKDHAKIMKTLKPVRQLDAIEEEDFRVFYKESLPDNTEVYQVEGSVGYIGFDYDGAKSQEYIIGGIMIHNDSINRIVKSESGIQFNELVPDEEELKTRLLDVKNRLDKQEIQENELQKEIEVILKTYQHSFEFVFKGSNVQKERAYIIKFDDKNILK